MLRFHDCSYMCDLKDVTVRMEAKKKSLPACAILKNNNTECK